MISTSIWIQDTNCKSLLYYGQHENETQKFFCEFQNSGGKRKKCCQYYIKNIANA